MKNWFKKAGCEFSESSPLTQVYVVATVVIIAKIAIDIVRG